MLRKIDQHLMGLQTPQFASQWQAWATEFWYFGLKEARACLFVGLFFLAVFTVPRAGVLGMPRYDVLLLVALGIQAWMLWAKLETWDEFKAIGVFHLVGFALEAFKVSNGIKSWSYPDFAYTKVLPTKCPWF